MGHVELEPYLVNGGSLAVELRMGTKLTIWYPMPRTKEDVKKMEDLVWSDRSDYWDYPTVLSEKEYLDRYCWLVRVSPLAFLGCCRILLALSMILVQNPLNALALE